VLVWDAVVAVLVRAVFGAHEVELLVKVAVAFLGGDVVDEAFNKTTLAIALLVEVATGVRVNVGVVAAASLVDEAVAVILAVLVTLVADGHDADVLVVMDVGRVVVDVLLLLLPLLALELHSGELNLTSVRNTEAPVACKPALSNADPKLEPWSEAIATSAARKLVDRSRSAIPFTTTALPRLRKRSPTWRAPAMSPLLASSTVRRLCQASLSASD